MSSTPLSSLTPYASPQDLLERYDVRTVGELASDTGIPLTAQQMKTSARILAAILDASGALESACIVGNRYTPHDLQSLTGASANFCKMLVCDLAMGRLVMARPTKDETPQFYTMALQWLERLRLGERIFGLQETADAGARITEDPFLESDLARLNLATYQCQRLFGIRGGRFRNS